MQGPLDPGSGAVRRRPLAEEYAAIRSANDLLAVIGTASALTAEEQSAISGFAHTLQAYNFLIILDAHTQDSIPIDVGTDVTARAGAVRTNARAYDSRDRPARSARDRAARRRRRVPVHPAARVHRLQHARRPSVQFNRALRARVAVYRGDFAGALTCLASRSSTPRRAARRGVYMDFGTGPGDFANPLAIRSRRPARTSATHRWNRGAAASPAVMPGPAVSRQAGATVASALDRHRPAAAHLGSRAGSGIPAQLADSADQERGADPAAGRGQHRAQRPRAGR